MPGTHYLDLGDAMSGFVLKRMGFAIITLIAVLTIVFFIVRILPGDPAMVILGDQASQQSIDLLRSRLGLDRPMIVQYFDFMSCQYLNGTESLMFQCRAHTLPPHLC